MSDSALNIKNLTCSKEHTYYRLCFLISLIVWFLALISIVGIIIAAAIFLLTWFFNGILIQYLKSDAVKISNRQKPELYKTFLSVCDKLKTDSIPELYIVESGGMLNAFTMRHSNRHFVALYSDIIEAYGETSDEIKFIIGHELGHIKRKHIIKSFFLAPGLLTPLLGSAYSRACESSCDRYGVYSCDNFQGAINGLMIIAGGKQLGKTLNPESFAEQHEDPKGFFRSIYELSSTYPPLSKRVSHLLAIINNKQLANPPRNILAYPFAIVTGAVQSTGSNGLISIMTGIAVLGLLVAIGVPGFLTARNKSRFATEKANLQTINEAIIAYEQNEGKELENINQLWPAAPDQSSPNSYIRKQLKCPLNYPYAINKKANKKTAYCTFHGESPSFESFQSQHHSENSEQSTANETVNYSPDLENQMLNFQQQYEIALNEFNSLGGISPVQFTEVDVIKNQIKNIEKINALNTEAIGNIKRAMININPENFEYKNLQNIVKIRELDKALFLKGKELLNLLINNFGSWQADENNMVLFNDIETSDSYNSIMSEIHRIAKEQQSIKVQ